MALLTVVLEYLQYCGLGRREHAARTQCAHTVHTMCTHMRTRCVRATMAPHTRALLVRSWSGIGVKPPAARRAVQLLHAALGASAPVVFADGSDTIVSNGAHHAARALGLGSNDERASLPRRRA